MSQKLNLKDSLVDDTLDLSMCNMEEVPVKEIASLPKVKNLDLANNNLVSLGKNFPVSLSHLVKLELANNRLRSLPENFGLLVNLRHLDLYKNELTTLPLSFGSLRSLRWLDLNSNPLVPKMAQVAGPCANTEQCQRAAKNVVSFMSSMQQLVEEEKKKRHQQRIEQEVHPTEGVPTSPKCPEKLSSLKKRSKGSDKDPGLLRGSGDAEEVHPELSSVHPTEGVPASPKSLEKPSSRKKSSKGSDKDPGRLSGSGDAEEVHLEASSVRPTEAVPASSESPEEPSSRKESPEGSEKDPQRLRGSGDAEVALPETPSDKQESLGTNSASTSPELAKKPKHRRGRRRRADLSSGSGDATGAVVIELQVPGSTPTPNSECHQLKMAEKEAKKKEAKKKKKKNKNKNSDDNGVTENGDHNPDLTDPENSGNDSSDALKSSNQRGIVSRFLSAIVKMVVLCALTAFFVVFIVGLIHEPTYNAIRTESVRLWKLASARLPKSLNSYLATAGSLSAKYSKVLAENSVVAFRAGVVRAQDAYVWLTTDEKVQAYAETLKHYWHVAYIKMTELVATLFNSAASLLTS